MTTGIGRIMIAISVAMLKAALAKKKALRLMQWPGAVLIQDF